MTAVEPHVFAVREATEHDKLTVLRLLAAGRDIEFTAEAAQLTRHQVAHLAGEYGHPDRDRLGWAADVIQQQLDKAAAPSRPPRPLSQRVAAPNPVRAPAPRTPSPAAPNQRQPAPSSGAKPATAAVVAAPEETRSEPIDAITELVADLIRAGMQSSKLRTRAAARKVVGAAQDLQTRLEAEAAARAEQTREAHKREQILTEMHDLEMQIAALKEKLHPPKKKPARHPK